MKPEVQKQQSKYQNSWIFRLCPVPKFKLNSSPWQVSYPLQHFHTYRHILNMYSVGQYVGKGFLLNWKIKTIFLSILVHFTFIFYRRDSKVNKCWIFNLSRKQRRKWKINKEYAVRLAVPRQFIHLYKHFGISGANNINRSLDTRQNGFFI